LEKISNILKGKRKYTIENYICTPLRNIIRNKPFIRKRTKSKFLNDHVSLTKYNPETFQFDTNPFNSRRASLKLKEDEYNDTLFKSTYPDHNLVIKNKLKRNLFPIFKNTKSHVISMYKKTVVINNEIYHINITKNRKSFSLVLLNLMLLI